MANTVIMGRQSSLHAITPLLGIANTGAGNGYDIKIPPGSHLLNVFSDTVTAFNAGTTNTLTVTDGTTVFVNGVDTSSTGRETVSNIGKYYPSGGTISVNLAQTGTAATAGAALVIVEYLVLNRVTEVTTN